MANLAELEDIPSRVATGAATRINVELRNQFLNGTDPYGTQWKPLAPYTIRKKGHDTRLVETGALARDTKAVPLRGAGIEIRSNEKGAWHQAGGPNLPRRPVLPDRADLPDAWLDAIDTETEKAFKKAMKRQ